MKVFVAQIVISVFTSWS